MSEFAKRVVFGLLAAPAFIACVWWDGWLFAGILLVIVWLMQVELARLFEAAQARTNLGWAAVAGGVVFLHPYIASLGALLFASLLILVLLEALRTDDSRQRRIVTSVFVAGYLPFMMSSLLLLRNAGGEATGFGLVLLLLLMVWGNDSFAYFGGKMFGRHPLAPSISPKKTWEGFGFGVLGAAVGFGLAKAVLPEDSTFAASLMWPLIPLVSVFGPVGDLVESRLKRHVNAKDSGTLLPGHGGFLDRFDALHLCAPVCFLYVEVLRWLNLFPH